MQVPALATFARAFATEARAGLRAAAVTPICGRTGNQHQRRYVYIRVAGAEDSFPEWSFGGGLKFH